MTDNAKIKLVFNIPLPDESGYLKRQRKALVLQAQIREDPKPEVMDALVLFLAEFVSEPVEFDDRVDALYDASENQITGLIDAIVGASQNDEGESVNPT